jgi:uncharacterized protein (TIGR03089 family)
VRVDLPAQALAHARREPGAPLVTFYDDDTGERTELSRATAQNWVAKTGGFLEGDLEVEPGDRVALALHPHWQTAVTALACWAVGASVVPADPDRGPDHVAAVLRDTAAAVVVAREDLLADLAAGRADLPALREVVGASQRPLGARLRPTPPGVLDLAAEVPPQPDDWAPPGSGGLDAEAVVTAGSVLTADALAARAGAVVDALGLSSADRLLLAPPTDALDTLVLAVAAPALSGSGIVLCRRWPGAGLAHRLEQERVTVLVVDEVQAASALADTTGPTGLRAVLASGAGDAPPVLADRLGVPLLRL